MTPRYLVAFLLFITACSGGASTDADTETEATPDEPSEINASAVCVDAERRACGTDEGACIAGTETCTDGAWGPCFGSTGPLDEVCDGSVDENCDGAIDEGCECENRSARPCGPDEGACVAGTQRCESGAWGACLDAIGPSEEVCDGSADENCDGNVDEGCDCVNDDVRSCGKDEGACVAGTETCAGGAWGECVDAIGPTDEICEGSVDENCDGDVDEGCSSDPFDPLSCAGVPWTETDALGRLGAAPREILAASTILLRSRSCPGGACDPWGTPADWLIRYLTYSGGVTTRYMFLNADMNLVVFLDGGTPKLSIQHVTFAAGGYPDSRGMVYGFPPEVIPYPHVRAYNVTPANASDYRDLDILVKDGTLVLGDRCARWTADPYGTGEPYAGQYGALFRW